MPELLLLVVVVGPPPLLPPPQSGSPRIPVLQELDGVVEALVVGFCEELEWSVGELLDEDCVVAPSLDECDVELGEEALLRLRVEEWWVLGAPAGEVVSPASLVPVGVGATVATGALDEAV